jgi:hypothetical protein
MDKCDIVLGGYTERAQVHPATAGRRVMIYRGVKI